MANNNKSLYGMWLEAHKKGMLPPEWRLAHNFLTWATANGYKVEHGYKGEFTPGNLKLAADNAKWPAATAESIIADINATVVGVDFASGPDKTVISYIKNADNLVKTKKLEDLKKLAADMEVDIGGATTKKEIATLIVAKGGAEDAGE